MNLKSKQFFTFVNVLLALGQHAECMTHLYENVGSERLSVSGVLGIFCLCWCNCSELHKFFEVSSDYTFNYKIILDKIYEECNIDTIYTELNFVLLNIKCNTNTMH